ncbi:uncharacterized protein B0I36DRAFT_352056 [Microdochium trichocladiopsis]|uniref:Uncharacterized protein n=1 Tax=Microdochium trichocladiopsis TaxID=1682393 RepID=A0A9P9BMR5_9PEZI|nr:uncharacterized protein B0I36DRAFT_352056 [Microdochium trichocladiopsis]KAH7026156.1 hypothetical protein B0I36DRAFT_352056 [Microdochium trichocladiopsis]
MSIKSLSGAGGTLQASPPFPGVVGVEICSISGQRLKSTFHLGRKSRPSISGSRARADVRKPFVVSLLATLEAELVPAVPDVPTGLWRFCVGALAGVDCEDVLFREVGGARVSTTLPKRSIGRFVRLRDAAVAARWGLDEAWGTVSRGDCPSRQEY